MTLDLTKPVQTRNGKPARIICTDANGIQPIVALIRYNEGEHPKTFYRDGRFRTAPAGLEHSLDLVNVSVKRKGWINIWGKPFADREEPRVFMHGSIWSTRAEADKGWAGGSGPDTRIACIEVEFEEGQCL